MDAVLIDNYLHKKKPLSLADSSFIDFIVDRNKESFANRFMVVFEKKGANINYGANKVNEATISIYPNPTKDKIINLHYSKMPAGRYTLQLLNLAGQIIFNSSIRISEPEGSQLIKPGKKAAFGNYKLLLISENEKKYVLQIIL